MVGTPVLATGSQLPGQVPETEIEFGDGVKASAVARDEEGAILLHFHGEEPVELLLERAGQMPLPPYIASKRRTDESDRSDYQTMFAREEGAVAAPTAALHFTAELMARLSEAGIGHETLTLHVGAGTFLPVKAEDTEAHRMHAEWGRIDAATADRLNAARAAGGLIAHDVDAVDGSDTAEELLKILFFRGERKVTDEKLTSHLNTHFCSVERSH